MPETTEKPQAVKGTYGTMYYVKDMAKASKFFQEKLGLKPSFESPDWTEFSVKGHSLCLHSRAGKEETPDNGCLILHVDEIKRLAADLKAQGVKFFGDVHEVHPGAWAATFADPDGNPVGLYEGPKSE